MKARYQLEARRTGKGTIYLAVTIQGKRVKANTGLKIEPIYWINGQPNKQQTVLNGKLNELSELVYTHSTEQAPTKQSITELVNRWKEGKKDNLIHIDELISKYKEHNTFAPRTLISKETHLNEFKKFAPHITANEINKAVLRNYGTYLKNKFEGYNANTTNNYIKDIKALVNWAFQYDYIAVNYSSYLKKLPAKQKQVIVITENELIALEQSDFSNNKRLDKVKDLFLFVCYTGLRFGDLKQVKRNNLINKELNIVQEKTKQLTQIPLIDEAIELLHKYNHKLPLMGNNTANEYLKEIFKELGLTRKLFVSNSEGIKPLDEVITFHVGRKSFITIALSNGVNRDVVKQLSGHQSEVAFSRYVNFSSEQIQKEKEKMSRKSKNPNNHLRAI